MLAMIAMSIIVLVRRSEIHNDNDNEDKQITHLTTTSPQSPRLEYDS